MSNFLVLLLLLACAANAQAQRQMENLDRGIVAINQGGKVFVSWRMLATDPPDTAFNVYRAGQSTSQPVKLNQQPIKDVTWFIDSTANADEANQYSVRRVLAGSEQLSAGSFTLPAKAPARAYLSVPLKTPPGYFPNDASVGDLDGDGEYDLVLHQ